MTVDLAHRADVEREEVELSVLGADGWERWGLAAKGWISQEEDDHSFSYGCGGRQVGNEAEYCDALRSLVSILLAQIDSPREWPPRRTPLSA